MRYGDVAELITVSITQNEFGDDVESKNYNEVFANEKPIPASEFYQAAATGIKPVKKIIVSSIDYSGEENLRYQNVEYSIIRTYDKGEKTELTCEGLVI